MKKRLALLVAMYTSIAAMGHFMPHSVLEFTLNDSDRVEVSIHIPVNQLQYAIPFQIKGEAGDSVQQYHLLDYLNRHFHVYSGRSEWTSHVVEYHFESEENPREGLYRELNVRMTLTPPDNWSAEQMVVKYDGVLHQVATHKVHVYLNKPESQDSISSTFLGVIELDIANNQVAPFIISFTSRNIHRSFSSVFKAGASHILGGTDHLLFLFMLLVVAPCLNNGGRWEPISSKNVVLKRVLLLTLSFAVGHAIAFALALTHLSWIDPWTVELIIAISVLLSAIHAMKPIIQWNESWIVFLFGLIHGTAFNNEIGELSPGFWDAAAEISAFNLGIEVVQLVVIVMMIPWLIFLSQFRAYTPLRWVSSLAVALISTYWIVLRVAGESINSSPQIEIQSRYLIFVVPVLILMSGYQRKWGAKRMIARLK